MKQLFSIIRFIVVFVLLLVAPIRNINAGERSSTISIADQQDQTFYDEVATSISAGLEHTCIVTSSGSVKCWGANYNGQVGDGTTTFRLLPVDVEGLPTGALQVTSGGHHDAFYSDGYTCVLTDSNGVKCWGANGLGQLGNGTNIGSLIPVDVIGLTSGVAVVSAGGGHTCALMQNGGVKCWGVNYAGELGDGTTVSKNYPVDVIGLTSGVVAISVGTAHSCAVLLDGSVRCWGRNYYGTLGNGTTTNSSTPVDVIGLELGAKTIAAGGDHSCAILDDNSAWCWGNNTFGQLGDNSSIDSSVPVLVQGLSSGCSEIAAGDSHSCVIMTTGAVKCWGRNDYGQLGDGSTVQRNIPVSVSGLSAGVTQIEAGYGHTCSILSSGIFECWGHNFFGQIGVGQTGFRSVPIGTNLVINQSIMYAIGGNHACAIDYDNMLRCWGANHYGQLGDGTNNIRVSPTLVLGFSNGANYVSPGGYHTCALNMNNGVFCWGNNKVGQLGINNTIDQLLPQSVIGLTTGIQAVSSGTWHTCALTSTGGVKCWGLNNSGQLGNGTTTNSSIPVDVIGLTSGVVAVKAGYMHTCALLDTGGMKCWGSNAYGILGDGTEESHSAPVDVLGLTANVKSISLGTVHTCALENTGVVKCWGFNIYGQLGQDDSVWKQPIPTDVQGLSSNITELSSGDWHNCVVNSLNQLKCWGANIRGQLGRGTINVVPPYGDWIPADTLGISNTVTNIASGGSSNCVRDGAIIKCWGNNSFGQVGDGQKGVLTLPTIINPSCPIENWYAEYYATRDFLSGPAFARCDATIDFYWGDRNPGNPLLNDNFSIKWRRTIDISITGWYRFRPFTDDGLRLYIDDELRIDNWVARSFDERSTTIFLSEGPHEVKMEYLEWSHEAMAYLNYYRCRTGLSDCSIEIPPEYQTEYLEVPMPLTCTTEPNQTIGRWGCLLTSISMALSNFGVYASPARLNEWLSGIDPDSQKSPRGYVGTCDASLIWDEIINYALEPENGGVELQWINTVNAVDVIQSQSLPVILSVNGKGHYILGVDVIDDNQGSLIGINDPYHSWACQVISGTPSLPPNSDLLCAFGALEHAITTYEEERYFGKVRPLTYLSYQIYPRTASLQLSIVGTDILLIDELGNKVGFDPSTGEVVSEIVNSFYFDSEIIPPGETTSGIIERTLYLPNDASGTYRVIIVNNTALQTSSTSTFNINIFGYDESFTRVDATLSGITYDGIEYELNYLPGVSIDLTQTVGYRVFLPLVTCTNQGE